jgi:hypothetical protein
VFRFLDYEYFAEYYGENIFRKSEDIEKPSSTNYIVFNSIISWAIKKPAQDILYLPQVQIPTFNLVSH